MRMLNWLKILGLVWLLSGCSRQDHYVAAKDKQLMDRAILRARSTHLMFANALQGGRSGKSGFAIKKSFPVEKDPDGEHMWLVDATWNGKTYSATIDNEPVETKAVKMGDKVEVRPDELSDWMYVEKGELIGGYTVRVLYHEATPSERREFDRELRCTIPPVDF